MLKFESNQAHYAFGNRTSRMLATEYPDRVASLTPIAAGGLVPALTQPGELSRLLGEADLPLAEKIRHKTHSVFPCNRRLALAGLRHEPALLA